MRRSYFIIVASLLLALAMCVALLACKKKDPVTTTSTTGASTLRCEKWGSNPLFTNGHVFHFTYHMDECSETMEEDGDESATGWHCDDSGLCTHEIDDTISCTVKLVMGNADYCASELSCTTKSKEDISRFAPSGIWAVDKNGVYYFGQAMPKRKATPECNGNNIFSDCAPGTLLYDYEVKKILPDIPFEKNAFCDCSRDSEGYCEEIFDAETDVILPCKMNFYQEGTAWKSSWSYSVGSEWGLDATFDEKRGIVEYSASGDGCDEPVVRFSQK